MDDRWRIEPAGRGIVWDVAADARLPHADHVEMSGRRVSLIVRYGVDADRRLTLACEVIWPTLRTRPNDVRGYLRRTIVDPPGANAFVVDGQPFAPGAVREVRFDGILSVAYEPGDGLAVSRFLFPTVDRTAVIDAWRIENVGASPRRVTWDNPVGTDRHENGVYGDYALWTMRSPPPEAPLEPGQAVTRFVAVAAWRESGKPPRHERFTVAECAREEARRRKRCGDLLGRRTLTVETPDPVLDAAFAMAKLRAGESLFETANLGLVHSPGGGRYYGGVWANDQAEYSGPLFAYLGDPDAQTAAENAYRAFARRMTPNFDTLPSSLEVEGTVAWGGAGDRGDAAMIAGGLARYVLARGDRALADEFWPAVAWCLEYVRRRTRPEDGVVVSDSDELEGRFPTGDANLSTSSLAYDALRRSADLARSLEKPGEAAQYDRRADALAAAIERHFGATVEGHETYRYYDGNTTLRAWICLPLCFGLATGARRAGTIEALFSPRLWTADGLATEAGDTVFWDRSTLYALRGVFAAGETETALRYLTAYSRRRLLGEHVPYPVEAYPEGGQAHLSAESALYCRVFTEGILGLVPTGLRSFTLTPRLPRDWPEMTVRLPDAFGHRAIEVRVEREDDNTLRTRVRLKRGDVLETVAPEGTTHRVSLPESGT